MYQQAAAIRKTIEAMSKHLAKCQVFNSVCTRNARNTSEIYSMPIGFHVSVYLSELDCWDGPFFLLEMNEETCKVLLPPPLGPKEFRSMVVRRFIAESHRSSNALMTEESNREDYVQALILNFYSTGLYFWWKTTECGNWGSTDLFQRSDPPGLTITQNTLPLAQSTLTALSISEYSCLLISATLKSTEIKNLVSLTMSKLTLPRMHTRSQNSLSKALTTKRSFDVRAHHHLSFTAALVRHCRSHEPYSRGTTAPVQKSRRRWGLLPV